jgi:hypothetical protein
MAFDNAADALEVPGDEIAKGLRIERLPKRGRALQVTEEDRDRLANPMIRLRTDRYPAVTAEAELLGNLLTTRRAGANVRVALSLTACGRCRS